MDIKKVKSLVSEDMYPVVEELVRDAKKWDRYIKDYQKVLDENPLSFDNIDNVRAVHNMLKGAQIQYTSIVRTLLQVIKKTPSAQSDEFEEYLNGYINEAGE